MTANWLFPEPWVESRRNFYPGHVRRHLLEQFEPFPGCAVFHTHETGDVAAWPRQAVDETSADRIDDPREYNRHRTGCLQQRPQGRAALSQNDVRPERDQFRRVSPDVVSFASGPAYVDPNVAADGPARLL